MLTDIFSTLQTYIICKRERARSQEGVESEGASRSAAGRGSRVILSFEAVIDTRMLCLIGSNLYLATQDCGYFCSS